MKLILALILCFIWEQETHAEYDYKDGVRKPGDVLLHFKEHWGYMKFKEFTYPGLYDYSPYEITRVAVYDSYWYPSKQELVEGGKGHSFFREQRRAEGTYMKVEYWIFGRYTGDQCVKNRTEKEAKQIVGKLS